MADNVNLTAGDGTIVAGTDNIGGISYPRAKTVWGPDGTVNDTDVASGKPLPVQLRGSDGTDRSNALPVSQSGTWTVLPGNTANTTAWKVDNTAALDKGSGTGGTATQRVIIDTTQLSTLATAFDVLNNAGGGQKVYLPTNQVVPNTVQSQTNGTTASRVNAANSTNATNLKASAGAITNIDVFNVAAYSVFLKFYNKASAPTVGSDTPIWTIPIAAGTGYSRHFQYGKWFGTGVSYAITKLQADSDTTVVAALDLTGSIDWI